MKHIKELIKWVIIFQYSLLLILNYFWLSCSLFLSENFDYCHNALEYQIYSFILSVSDIVSWGIIIIFKLRLALSSLLLFYLIDNSSY